MTWPNGWLEQNPFLSSGLTLMVVGALMAALRSLPGRLWCLAARRITITVEVPDRDPAFRWIQTWLARQRYARRARSLSLMTVWSGPDADPCGDDDPDDDDAPSRASRARFLLSPAPGLHVMAYRGRPLILMRSRRDLEAGGAMAIQETLTLRFLGGNRALIDDLLGEAQHAAMPRVPGVNILTVRHANWVATSWKPRRPLASIVLADDMLDDLLADLRAFFGAARWYATRGVPHRRGYLLHGPPGNGKTTLVTAAAGELGLSVAALSLNNSAMSDEGLRTLVDALPAGALLLIEDVDCAFAEREASDRTGVTLSGLLNALDGVSSREGRVLFLTTNHPERLDPALVRPGRVDRSLYLGHTTRDQARRLFEWFYTGGENDTEVDRLAREFAQRVPERRVCMAAIQEHLLRHRADPEAAVQALDLDPATLEAGREDLAEAAAARGG